MYDNVMNKFAYGNMEVPGVYLDETNRRLSYNLRNAFGRLAGQLNNEGKKEEAVKVLDLAMEKMPEEKFAFNYFIFGVLEGYYQAGAKEKGSDMLMLFADRLDEELSYYQQFKGSKREAIQQEIQSAAQYYQMLLRLYQQYEAPGSNVQESEFFKRYQNALRPFGLA